MQCSITQDSEPNTPLIEVLQSLFVEAEPRPRLLSADYRLLTLRGSGCMQNVNADFGKPCYYQLV